MHKEFKQPWIDALRSGKYQQGKGYLKTTENRYCCLGVLQEINGRMTDEVLDCLPRWVASLARNGIYCYKSETDRICDLSHSDKMFYGLSGAPGAEVAELMLMNDRGVPFNEIADWIEENL